MQEYSVYKREVYNQVNLIFGVNVQICYPNLCITQDV